VATIEVGPVAAPVAALDAELGRGVLEDALTGVAEEGADADVGTPELNEVATVGVGTVGTVTVASVATPGLADVGPGHGTVAPVHCRVLVWQ